MKKIIFFGILMIALFLITGFGCSKVDEIKNDTTPVAPENNRADTDGQNAAEDFEEGRVLVDRIRYAQAGNPPFDSTNVVFHNKKETGYRAEIISDNNIKVEVLTDKDCILKGQGDKYNIIQEDDGSNVVFIGEKNQGDDRNLCIAATATGNGQVEIKFKVVELI